MDFSQVKPPLYIIKGRYIAITKETKSDLITTILFEYPRSEVKETVANSTGLCVMCSKYSETFNLEPKL